MDALETSGELLSAAQQLHAANDAARVALLDRLGAAGPAGHGAMVWLAIAPDDGRLRTAAASRLPDGAPPAAVAMINAALRSGEAVVVERAAELSIHLGAVGTIPALITAVETTEPRTLAGPSDRRSGRRSRTGFNPCSISPGLAGVARVSRLSSTPTPRDAARNALRILARVASGEPVDFGDDADAWRAWDRGRRSRADPGSDPRRIPAPGGRSAVVPDARPVH